jgi:hypothetical protein
MQKSLRKRGGGPGLILLLGLLLCAQAALAYTGWTGWVTGGGTNSNQTSAGWDMRGKITYTSYGTSGGTVHYTWTELEAYFTPDGNYVDASVPYRAVIYKTPEDSGIWESCEQNNFDMTPLDPNDPPANRRIFDPGQDNDAEEAMQNSLVYKVQTKLPDGEGQTIVAEFHTLLKDAG